MFTPKTLRERAEDSATLSTTANPQTAKAVKAVLLHLADLMEEKPKMKVERVKVAKRQVD